MESIWRVRRSATDTKVAGLCAGVAEHWDIDPVLVRVGFVLLALSGGVGLVLYAAGWLLVPRVDRSSAAVDDVLGTRRWPREVWVAIVALACLAVFAVFGSLSPFGVGPALILACVWYFGFYRHRASATPDPVASPAPVEQRPAGPATPFTTAAEAWRLRIQEHTRSYEAQAAPHGPGVAPRAAAPAADPPFPPASPLPPTSPRLPSPPRPPSPPEPDPFWATPDPVGLYAPAATRTTEAVVPPRRGADRTSARRLRLSALVVLGLVLTGLGLADRTGAAVSPAVYAATALLVVGLTLVAATWLGRARGLLPVGLLLVPVVVVASLLGPVGHLDRWDDLSRQYPTVASLPASGDTLPGGRLAVDLSGLSVPSDTAYSAHVGTGQLAVTVPAASTVVLDYRVGLGGVVVVGQQLGGGSDRAGTTTLAGAKPGGPTLTLHLSVDRGQLEVTRR